MSYPAGERAAAPGRPEQDPTLSECRLASSTIGGLH